ncbi:MAG: hypothetical protein ACRENB_12160 [Gemmatimonadales bacterium]
MPRYWTAGLLLTVVCAPPEGGGDDRGEAGTPAAQAAEAKPSDLVACLGQDQARRFSLVLGLREISGLAAGEDGRLFTHNDERGQIGVLDPANGRLVKAFALGPAPARADFEGIAVAGGSIFLMTSDGRILETREGKASETVPFTLHDTGAGKWCEFEGLAYEPRDRALLLLCKTPLHAELRGTVTVFRWSIGDAKLLSPDHLSVPLPVTFQQRFGRDFRGSGLERDPVSGDYLAISAANGAAVLFARDGKLVSFGPLSRRHLQPEALTILPDGRVVVGDEGGKGAGMLSIYSCGR